MAALAAAAVVWLLLLLLQVGSLRHSVEVTQMCRANVSGKAEEVKFSRGAGTLWLLFEVARFGPLNPL